MERGACGVFLPAEVSARRSSRGRAARPGDKVPSHGPEPRPRHGAAAGRLRGGRLRQVCMWGAAFARRHSNGTFLTQPHGTGSRGRGVSGASAALPVTAQGQCRVTPACVLTRGFSLSSKTLWTKFTFCECQKKQELIACLQWFPGFAFLKVI